MVAAPAEFPSLMLHGTATLALAEGKLAVQHGLWSYIPESLILLMQEEPQPCQHHRYAILLCRCYHVGVA